MFPRTGGYTAPRAGYAPSGIPARSVYRQSYVRPGYGYRPRLPPPVVPAGRAPGGAGLLAAILGPIGGLTGCLCCLNTIGIWGLFITSIPLVVFLYRWKRDYRNYVRATTGSDGSGVEQLMPQFLLLFIVLIFSLMFQSRKRN